MHTRFFMPDTVVTLIRKMLRIVFFCSLLLSAKKRDNKSTNKIVEIERSNERQEITTTFVTIVQTKSCRMEEKVGAAAVERTFSGAWIHTISLSLLRVVFCLRLFGLDKTTHTYTTQQTAVRARENSDQHKNFPIDIMYVCWLYNATWKIFASTLCAFVFGCETKRAHTMRPYFYDFISNVSGT